MCVRCWSPLALCCTLVGQQWALVKQTCSSVRAERVTNVFISRAVQYHRRCVCKTWQWRWQPAQP